MGKKDCAGEVFGSMAVVLALGLIPISFLSNKKPDNQPTVSTPHVSLDVPRADILEPIPLTMMWPVAESEITSHFGLRDVTGCWVCDSNHTGLDFGGAWNQPIPASVAGVVTVVGWHYGLGYWVVVSDGSRSYVYGHLAAYSNPPEVFVGAQVSMGQTIGLMGSTGFSTGPHLHFEIWENNVTPVDPYPILKEQTVQRYQ
jgi:murein DD-endopeptidase MepM/ murein hydrolase activator NlpD